MSVALERPVTPPATGSRPGGRRVAPALARVEGARLLRHPILIGGAALSAALYVVVTWNEAPVLHLDDIYIGAALGPFAAATLLAANLAVLRASRHGTEELFESFATPVGPRTTGHLMALAWPGGAAVALAGGAMLYLLLFDPVGYPNVFELLVGPAIVTLAGALGIVAARWWAHPISGLTALAVVGLPQLAYSDYWVIGSNVYGYREWLALWIPPQITVETPPDLSIRPAPWHLLYLAGMVVVVGALARVRNEGRIRPLAVGGAAFAVVLLAAQQQTRPPSLEARLAVADLVARPRITRCARREAASPTAPIATTCRGSIAGRDR